MKHHLAALAALAAASAFTVSLSGPASAQAAGHGSCDGHVATIVGTPGSDVLRGSPGEDVIVGLGGNDVIEGRGDSDVICGGPGRDRITGGPSRDLLWGGAGDDVVRGGTGGDSIMGNAGRNRLYGDGGGDVIRAKGSDVVHGGRGHDSIVHFDSNDSVYGGIGPDLLSGIVRVGRHPVVDGGGFQNTLRLDVLPAASAPQRPLPEVAIDLGHHSIRAGGWTQRLRGQFTGLYVNDGSDALAWIVDGTRFGDWILMDDSSAVPITVNGRGGNDHLAGGRGDDTLIGGLGIDLAYAGDGQDTCDSIAGPLGDHDGTSCEITS